MQMYCIAKYCTIPTALNISKQTHISPIVCLRHISSDFHYHLHVGWRQFLDERENAEGRAVLAGDPVVDHCKFAVGGEEVEHSVPLKLVELHAVVEVAIVQHYRTVRLCVALADNQIFIESKAKLRVACQVTFHLDASLYAGIEHLPAAGEHHLKKDSQRKGQN